MTKDNTNFIDPSKKTLYGKHGAEFWIGKIVAYADQKEQIDKLSERLTILQETLKQHGINPAR